MQYKSTIYTAFILHQSQYKKSITAQTEKYKESMMLNIVSIAVQNHLSLKA